MSFKAEGLAIEQRMLTNWSGDEPVFIDGDGSEPSHGQSHLAITVTSAGASLEGFTSTHMLDRNIGLIIVDVFTPWGSGNASNRELCDSVLDIFSGQQFSGITCETGSAVRVGKSGEWLQYSVSIPFRRDKYRSRT